MSITVDVFIKYPASKARLAGYLERELLVFTRQKHYWLLGFIEVGLQSRAEDPDSFVDSRFRPYNYVLYGTSYHWSSQLGSAAYVHTIVLDSIAQVLAARLRTRTMVSIP